MAGKLTRIHLHWTAGADGVNPEEKDHYHFIIGRDGGVTLGDLPPEANIPPIKGAYAAHTLNANGGAIGVSLDAMGGAVERPFSAGKYPITEAQLDAMAKLVAGLCKKYGIPVTRKTVLTHAEVQPTLGIAQKQKWDITWLPGMDKPGDPIAVGDILRARITKAINA
jgi:N-acetyl-anhydromuramyl-L-alanine amidase AmpD